MQFLSSKKFSVTAFVSYTLMLLTQILKRSQNLGNFNNFTVWNICPLVLQDFLLCLRIQTFSIHSWCNTKAEPVLA